MTMAPDVETTVEAKQRLAVAAGTALLGAGLILVMFVLPAEYGVDPIGTGRWFGLTELGATGKQIEADHVDATQGKTVANRCVICGHIDADAKGCKEWDLAPYYPMGAVQSKVTTADLAKNMQFWAHMGHPCGESFIGADFYKKHPEYAWQAKYLNNMLSYPWTLFSASAGAGEK